MQLHLLQVANTLPSLCPEFLACCSAVTIKILNGDIRNIMIIVKIMLIHASASQELDHVTAEKQTPSAIDFVGTIRSAIDLERRMASKSAGSGKALKDLLSKVVAEYNRLVTVKKHRIDGSKRQLCYNMLLVD